jgi:tetratricopeptide (TPR) repeat protein
VKARRVALLGVAGLLSGCVYYNALYNAQRLLDEGEHARRAGQDSVADVRYRDVVRKAAEGYRDQPAGPWAADALLLLGRARLRLGNLAAAEAALARSEELASTPEMKMEARLYRGIALLTGGEMAEGTSLVSQALAKLRRGPVAAEGHLWRGDVLLAAGTTDMGWWDLRQATEMDRALRTSATLARARWAVHYDDTLRARTSFDRLLSYREAGAREDTVATLAGAAAARWGAGVAARFLEGVDTTMWASTPRGRIRVERARFLRAAGDTTAAESIVRHVADGVGPAAIEARLTLAHWRLGAARDADAVHEVARLLVGSKEDSSVVALLGAIRRFEGLVEAAPREPLAWFAAAETARDGLGARVVARELYLQYADSAPGDPWVPKALLAALSLTQDEGDRAWLRGRLERHATSPYVLAARGEPAPGIDDLEAELARRLKEIVTR